MKLLVSLMVISILGVSCSSTKSKSIKSLRFEDKVGQNVGQKEFKKCQWKFSVMNTQDVYEGLVIDEMVKEQSPNYVAARNLEINQTGMGVSGLGRYCVEAKGEFYATQK